jgi:hypothetical protein
MLGWYQDGFRHCLDPRRTATHSTHRSKATPIYCRIAP